MGLFDFLKTKDKPVEERIQLRGNHPECDNTKTQVIANLLAIPHEQRDDNWHSTFYENVQTASFTCGNPQVFTGPDELPYFALHITGSNIPGESFCIRGMKDDLLHYGYGISINPTPHGADWVFSNGDILNLHMNQEFFTASDLNLPNEVTIQKDEQILLAQPLEAYLPARTRQLLKTFLQSKGVKRPQVMLVSRPVEGRMLQQLAFNIFPEDFKSQGDLNYRLAQISWFLPRHYTILILPRKSELKNNLADL